MNNEEELIVEYLDNDILSKSFVNEYNVDICTKLANKVMHRFVTLKNKYPFEPSIKLTPNYEPIYTCPLPRQNKQMDEYDKNMDEKAEFQFMNEKLKAMMKIMNSFERKCFTEKFLHEKTEYHMAKVLGISRDGLKPYIRSSVIRIVLTFGIEVMANEDYDFDETGKIEFDYSDYIVEKNK